MKKSDNPNIPLPSLQTFTSEISNIFHATSAKAETAAARVHQCIRSAAMVQLLFSGVRCTPLSLPLTFCIFVLLFSHKHSPLSPPLLYIFNKQGRYLLKEIPNHLPSPQSSSLPLYIHTTPELPSPIAVTTPSPKCRKLHPSHRHCPPRSAARCQSAALL